jgi:hypothetical protein
MFLEVLTVGNGPSDLVGRSVRGSAENGRRAHRAAPTSILGGVCFYGFLGVLRFDSK